MKTAVIFCNKISERNLSQSIKKILHIETKSKFFHYPTVFDLQNLRVEILKNHGGEDIDGKYYKWYVDISSQTSDGDNFKNEISKLNRCLRSRCKTWIDWDYYVNL
jgi:hypothetical protein